MGKHPPNLKIRLYGVQGSSSTFPSRAEREAFRVRTELELLEHMLRDVGRHLRDPDREDGELEALLAGEIAGDTLLAYRARFDVAPPKVYGGWTTCVHVHTADGYDLVFDCGSGFRSCAEALQKKWGDRAERHLHLFGSHSHVDHTEGFDLAAVCFDPRNVLHVYGNGQFLAALDENLGIFSGQVEDDRLGVHTPVHHELMPATFEAVGIAVPEEEEGPEAELARRWVGVGEPIVLGETTVLPFEVHHPAPCLAYRVEREGKVFVFCTDHELRRGGDPTNPKCRASREAEERLRHHTAGADLLYRDGQYLRAEYDGEVGIGTSPSVSRVGWGHSCIEDVEEMAVECGVKFTLIGHHDPMRHWRDRNLIDEELRGRNRLRAEQVELARAEGVIKI
jgi:phosphoribosyl 1,2-cyclic phosphodiesterase